MTNASAVARTLKKAGLNTVPTRTREGLHVTNAGWPSGTVYLAIQHDAGPTGMAGWARRLKDSALDVLRTAGYTVVSSRAAGNDDGCDLFVVTKEAGR